MTKRVKYPIGYQSFEVLREENRLYVDKTRFIEELLHDGSYYFLARPRRFGKSLFLSTLKCFFEGKRNLFKGLYADTMDWGWEPHPVLYLDINVGSYTDCESLDILLDNQLKRWEKEYEVREIAGNLEIRFANVIRAAYHNTGKRVVILVDEYDKPLVSNLNDLENFEELRNKLAGFYSNFKSNADYIRMVFLTGVSRFGKLSVFSGLNNINDITFDRKYSDICGISQDELTSYFSCGIKELSIFYEQTEHDIITELKKRYDGYMFAPGGKEIYNPYSLIIVMDKSMYGNYWIESGQATLLKNQIKKFNVDLDSLLHARCSIEALKGLDLDNPRPISLLYQTGYLTIKAYDKKSDIYTLGIPNREVEEGFLMYLLPSYANLHGEDTRFFVHQFVEEFNSGDVKSFMHRLTGMFASVPYDMEMDREQNIHNALLMMMILVGLDVETEYRTSDGRIDLFVKTHKYYYIIEIKLDGSAREALKQIEDKNYALPFSTDNREIIKIGVNFSSKTRTISEWISSNG